MNVTKAYHIYVFIESRSTLITSSYYPENPMTKQLQQADQFVRIPEAAGPTANSNKEQLMQ